MSLTIERIMCNIGHSFWKKRIDLELKKKGKLIKG
jgi:hypothetical protein